MSSTTSQCCNAATFSVPGPTAIVQSMRCSSCRLNVALAYDGVIQSIEEFLFDPSKPSGVHWLELVGPRDQVIHSVLSQLLYSPDESRGEVPYDEPDFDDVVKLVWWERRAVGFYTVKPEGPRTQLSNPFIKGMPTLDTAFTLPSYRGQGLGLAMMRDLVVSYPDRDLAVSHPLSVTMWMVLKKYLEQNPEMRRKIWLVKGDCEEGNKTLVWFCLRRQGFLE